MVDVKEVAGVGFRALVDLALLCPNQEEVVCKRIKPHCCARACMNMCVCGGWSESQLLLLVSLTVSEVGESG